MIEALEAALLAVCGLDAICLQPAAGAQGELLGMLLVRAYHVDRGDARRRVLIPASAHGTNPASSALCGYQRDRGAGRRARHPRGRARWRPLMDDSVAALMVTNPNTLGLFEEEIEAIAEVVHARGGLVYMDGANMNALMGVAKPGDMGVDVMQFNLHKTFSTPHGGGGPGAGPVAVRASSGRLSCRCRAWCARRRARLDEDFPKSVGRVRSFYGNFGILVRALGYIAAARRPGAGATSRGWRS